MKLRNKNTHEEGVLVDVWEHAVDRKAPFYIESSMTDYKYYYQTFAEMVRAGWEVLNEPTEPLIKDEKIRKAVRAWAEALYTNIIHVSQYDCLSVFRDEQTGYRLELVTDNIQHGTYTITELCGEEE